MWRQTSSFLRQQRTSLSDQPKPEPKAEEIPPVPTSTLRVDQKTIDRYAYLPFGAGPRVCIGASFSLQEAVVVLATIVQAVRFELLAGHEVTPVQRITLRPNGGLPMRLTRRKKG